MVYEIICLRKEKEKRKLKGSVLIKKQANEASKITRERPAKKADVVKQVAHLREERLWLILPAKFMVGSVDLHVGKLIDPCEKTYAALKEIKKNDLTKVLFLADFKETKFDGIIMVYKFLLLFFVFFYHYFYIYIEYSFFFSECLYWAHIISFSSLLIHFPQFSQL